MSAPSFSWDFENGYSGLLDTATVRLRQETGPSILDTRSRIRDLVTGRKNLEVIFSLDRTISGSIPSFFRWALKPETEIQVTLIPEKKAFRGNFRVPSGNFAVQWKLIPAVAAGSTLDSLQSISAVAGTRLAHTWIELFPEETPVAEAIRAAWENCVNPFDSRQAMNLSSRQVLRWNWTGFFRSTAAVEYSLEKGWTVEADPPGFRYRMPFSAGLSFRNKLTISTAGHFHLQLSKKDELLKLSVIKEKNLDSSASGSAGFSLGHSPSLAADSGIADPLLKPAEKELKKCLSRKISLALAAEAGKWHRKKSMLKAVWEEPFSRQAESEYGTVLSGGFLSPRENLSFNGKHENLHGRNFAVKLNILNWTAGIEKEDVRFDRVTAGPGGNLLFEKGVSRTSVRYKWDEIEFVRLVFSRKSSGGKASFGWDWESEGEFSREELVAVLKSVLHGKVIPRFSIPGGLDFPLSLRIKALSLVYPRRYRKGSFWRDWIDYPEVRQEITRNPAHCHLDSCYPLKGRSDMQRMQVAYDYRKALRFLEIMDLWQTGRDPVDLLEKDLNFPLFLYFHLLCPPRQKNSLLAITGDWEMGWEQVSKENSSGSKS